MKNRRNVSFPTKLLSNHHYLNEVSVEGKKTRKFHFHIGWYDLYAGQIIRTGNCITLLSNPYSLTVDTFWNIHYFEDITKFIFWTFNNSFRLKLIDQIALLPVSTIKHCLTLLDENFTPFDENRSANADEELQWCYQKNNYLKNDKAFRLMYQLDKENRTAIKEALERRTAGQSTETIHPTDEQQPSEPSFLDLLRPMNDSSHETLYFIARKTEEAEFPHNLFQPVPKLTNGKNPYGLNGSMAAMIDFFYQHNYFKKGCTPEQIFRAYFAYSGNEPGKRSTFFSEFRDDNNFIKYSDKLKALKIQKLP